MHLIGNYSDLEYCVLVCQIKRIIKTIQYKFIIFFKNIDNFVESA